MSQWFRMYSEALEDPKVQKLTGDLFKFWVNLLCLTSKLEGKLPSNSDIAFSLRMTEKTTNKMLLELEASGLLDRTDAGLQPHNWESRQFKSDTSNERVKRHRERHRNVTCNVTPTVTVTAPDTDTDTDTDTDNTPPLSPPAVGKAQRRGSRLNVPELPADWREFATVEGHASPDREWLVFRDYWRSQPGAKGVKLDWFGTWRNWVRRSVGDTKPKAGPAYYHSPGML